MTWLSTHRWPVAVALALVVGLASGWALHRPAPRIKYREQETHREKVAAHATEQAQAETHQDTAAAQTASLATHHRVHRRQVVRTAADGSQISTTDELIDDGLTLETAQEVVIHLQTASLVLGALDLTQTASASRAVEVVQTPEEPPRWAVTALGGLSTDGPVYGGQGGWSPGKVPLFDVPLWLRGQVTAGARLEALVGVGVEF